MTETDPVEYPETDNQEDFSLDYNSGEDRFSDNADDQGSSFEMKSDSISGSDQDEAKSGSEEILDISYLETPEEAQEYLQMLLECEGIVTKGSHSGEAGYSGIGGARNSDKDLSDKKNGSSRRKPLSESQLATQKLAKKIYIGVCIAMLAVFWITFIILGKYVFNWF